MNFSGISSSSFVGRVLRSPLRLIPSELTARVLQGPLKGLKWTTGSGNHGYWLGSYENDRQRELASLLRDGMVVYDIGAHVGYYTLLSSLCVGSTGQVYAFEPLPRNLRYLQRHIELNACHNVVVVAKALGTQTLIRQFQSGSDSSQGRLSESGSLDVEGAAIDDLIEREKLRAADFIKIDVEGAELEVLKGAACLLEGKGPTIVLELHGAELEAECATLLESFGYEVETAASAWDMIAKPTIAAEERRQAPLSA